MLLISRFAISLQRVSVVATGGSEAASQRGGTLRSDMRVTITCEECGERHKLERRVTDPGPIWIICHNCELPLQAVLDGPTVPAAVPAPPAKPSAWSGVVDFSSAT